MTGCVLDTDVVIAALDRSDAQHRASAEAVRVMVGENVPLLLSLIDYAETLVRPAEDESGLSTAIGAIDAARLRALNISLAGGFALATARAHDAMVASFDRRVRRALRPAGVDLAPALG